MHALPLRRLFHLWLLVKSLKKGDDADYLKKVSMAKNMQVSANEKLKESQLILITLGGLGQTNTPFVMSILTHFDHLMCFETLKQLLLNYKITMSD